MTTDIRDVLTLAEAAAEFGRKDATLRKAARTGALRARKVGRLQSQVWITTREAVADYLATVVLLPTRDPSTGHWIHGPIAPSRRKPKRDRRAPDPP